MLRLLLQKNGLQASMCCKVGDDDFGHFLLNTLAKYHVTPASPELCKEAVTTMAFVSLAADGERVFTFARKPGADMFLSEEEVRDEDLENSVIIHAGSCSLSAPMVAGATRKALRVGHEKGKLISFDVNYRNLMWHNDLDACTKAVMGYSALCRYVENFGRGSGDAGGEDALPELMKKNQISLLVETLGSEGAQAFLGNQIIRVHGKKVKAVDATGAGDAFWGGFYPA